MKLIPWMMHPRRVHFLLALQQKFLSQHSCAVSSPRQRLHIPLCNISWQKYSASYSTRSKFPRPSKHGDQMVQVFSENDMFVGKMSLLKATDMAARQEKELVQMKESKNEQELKSFRLVSALKDDDVSDLNQSIKRDNKNTKISTMKMKTKIQDHDFERFILQIRKKLEKNVSVHVMCSGDGVEMLVERVIKRMEDTPCKFQKTKGTEYSIHTLFVPSDETKSSE